MLIEVIVGVSIAALVGVCMFVALTQSRGDDRSTACWSVW